MIQPKDDEPDLHTAGNSDDRDAIYAKGLEGDFLIETK